MSRIRDIASILTASSDMSTDVEVATAVSNHAAASNPHTEYVQKTLTTTTGDIIYASSANTPARLGIGSTSQVLSVSGGVPTWTTPASGALTKITSASFSTVSDTGTTFDNVFSDTYNNYKIVFSNLNASAVSTDYLLRLRTAGPTTKTTEYYGNILSNGSNATQSNTSSYKLIATGAGEVSALDMTFFRDGSKTCWAFNGFQRTSNTHVTGAGFNDGVGANVATGFILYAPTGTISGFVAVYGMAD